MFNGIKLKEPSMFSITLDVPYHLDQVLCPIPSSLDGHGFRSPREAQANYLFFFFLGFLG